MLRPDIRGQITSETNNKCLSRVARIPATKSLPSQKPPSGQTQIMSGRERIVNRESKEVNCFHQSADCYLSNKHSPGNPFEMANNEKFCQWKSIGFWSTMWVKKISIRWAVFTRRFAHSRKAITSTVSALLISITALFSSSSHAQVDVAGVQTEIPATGISYGGSSCSTSTTGLWCGPVGVATDSSGNIYVANFSASQIIKLDAATHTPTVLLGYGSGTTGVGHPQQMAMDSSDNLFIADPDNSRVVKYSTTTNAVTASYPIAIYPFAVGVDSSGNAWIGGPGSIYEVPAGSADGTSAIMKLD
jgi:hypothetical protein